ncbi:hypothetical protein KPL71_007441 [Citrus sinensis]|uniref:Uncharacterized protein n=1 Tax=Citrus sinensis TaxID=2711 RepID=A0ACB8LZR9_CITSI|nr:hypothetical protein KPL71_007441 [Citrus sinensis]
MNMRPNWELKQCCNHEQLWRTILLKPFKLVTVFLHEASHAIACKLTCGKVEGIQVHADEGGTTQTRGGVYLFILPAGYLGSSFWGMLLILASTTLLTARIAAGCLVAALLVVLLVAKNWTLRGLCIGKYCHLNVESSRFVIFLGVIWVLQETTDIRILRYIILFIGVMNSLFSVLVHSSDAEKFAEVCPCPCNGIRWGIIWGLISFFFLCGAMYFGLVILS